MNKEAKEVIDIEAEVTENKGLSVSFTPAAIEANFAALDEQITQMVAGYADAKYDLTTQENIKQAKRDSAYINSIVKEIEDRRKFVKRVYMDPYNEFESKVNAIVAKAKDARENIKRQLDEAEEARKNNKYAMLQEHYEAFAGVLVDLVPYEQIHEKQWLNKSFGEVKAKKAIEDKVSKIASDWESLKVQSEMAHYDTAERTFFRTLDLGEALSAARKAQEEDERIAELHKEVEQIQEQVAEPVVQELEPIEHIDDQPVPAPMPAPAAPIPDPAPAPVPPLATVEDSVATPGAEYIPCVMIIQAASPEQMRAIGKFCGSLHPKVVGRFVGGTIEQAYTRLAQEAGAYYER